MELELVNYSGKINFYQGHLKYEMPVGVGSMSCHRDRK